MARSSLRNVGKGNAGAHLLAARWCAAAVLSVLLVDPANRAVAQDSYPSHPVKIIAPQQPGGGVDVVARIMAEKLGRAMGQPFIVENEAGAGGAIAAAATARARADGYTLMIGYVATHGTNAALKKGSYDAVRDFTPIAMVGGTPNILVVTRAVPVSTLQEFVSYAKAHPKQVDYGTSGVGTLNHLVMEQFKHASGVASMSVPYRSIGQAFTDAMSGQIQVIFPTVAAALPHLRSGVLKPLAITGDKRSPLLPEVPTFKESGYEGFDALTWYGIVGPAKMPEEITRRLNAEINRILASPELQDSFKAQALTVMPMTPAQFGKYIADEGTHWREVARASGITAE